MNDTNENFALRYTTVNRPQLQHAESQQSITASEDYFSATEASTESDERTRRYSTPPSRRISPAVHEHQPIAANTSQPRTRRANVTFHPNTIAEGNEESSQFANQRRTAMGTTSPATTPGLDDTPYIRFAIDQLTRDEEVRGSRHYYDAPEESEASYPTERVISDEGLGYFNGSNQTNANVPSSQAQRPRTPQRNSPDSMLIQPVMPAAAVPTTPTTPEAVFIAPERGVESGYLQRRSVPNAPTYPPRHPDRMASWRSSLPSSPSHSPQRGQFRHPELKEAVEEPQEQHPSQRESRRVSRPVSIPESRRDSIQRDFFVPYKPGRESLRSPPLTFLPTILRPLWLLLFAFLCCLMVAGLVFSAVWSLQNRALWEYDNFGGGRYFIFQYLPTLLGMLLLLWLFQIQTAVQRVTPFMTLTSEAARVRSEALFLKIHPTTFIVPHLQYFKAGQPLVGVFALCSWLFIFTIPLLASAYNVRRNPDVTTADGPWLWVGVQGVIWATVALYIFEIISVLLLIYTFARNDSGLKWDPRSLADIITLLERANMMKDYSGCETLASTVDLRKKLSRGAPQLGYWHTSRRPTDVFYGIGEPGGETRRFSIDEGRIREQSPAHKFGQEGKRGSVLSLGQGGGDFSIRMDIRSSRVRRRYLPWYLKDTFVVAWCIIAIVLFLALLVVSFVNNAVRDGFLPTVRAAAGDQGFSPSNFLYSFIPAVIGTLLFLFWQTLDLTFRHLQPFAALSLPSGATAEESLLLDYTARLPISVTVIAAANGHYRVAYLSLLSLVNIAIPILAGGVFWTQFYPGSSTVRVTAHLPGFYALCVFLALYATTICVILRDRNRMALPHRAASLADMITWLYQSLIVADRAFARPNTKADLVTRLMGPEWAMRSTFSRSLLQLVNVNPSTQSISREHTNEKLKQSRYDEEMQGSSPNRLSTSNPGAVHYGFGIHVGRDGLEHLGIDRINRGPGREMVLYEEKAPGWRYSRMRQSIAK